MNKQRIIRRTLLALALTAFGASSMAQVSESEPNNPLTFDGANLLTLSGGKATVTGTVGRFGANHDVDFFAFEVQKDDIIKVDIGGTSYDTWVFLFGPRSLSAGEAPDPTFVPFALKAQSGDEPLDENSTCDCDPRIDAFTATHSGRWFVGVTADPQRLVTGGTTVSRPAGNGAYTLYITVTSAELPVHIDIKPGSPISPINPKAQGTVPVALLSSDKFNPLDVDTASLRFGKTGDEQSFRRCNPSESRDLNADGRADLVCHFDNGATGFQRGDMLGTLKGKTKTGQAFKGTGDLKAVPEKRQN